MNKFISISRDAVVSLCATFGEALGIPTITACA